MNMDELWPHMWKVMGSSGASGVTSQEWWECSCGLKSEKRDPSHTWERLWWEAAGHLVDVGQLTPDQAGKDPYAGYSAPQAEVPNPLWAFRSDLSIAERRKAREHVGLGLPGVTNDDHGHTSHAL